MKHKKIVENGRKRCENNELGTLRTSVMLQGKWKTVPMNRHQDKNKGKRETCFLTDMWPYNLSSKTKKKEKWDLIVCK